MGFKSPLEVLRENFPFLRISNGLTPRIFGCICFVHINSGDRSKLYSRALKCVFVGYSSTQKGYKCYHPPTKFFSVYADVTFNEVESYFTKQRKELQKESKYDDLNMIISFPSQSQNHPIEKPNQSSIDNSNIELIYPMSPLRNLKT